MTRCIAYDEEMGRMCGRHAYILDRQRGGLVCAMHHREDGEHDAALDLAIEVQRYEIELRLVHLRVGQAFAKKILGREGRCLPQSGAHRSQPNTELSTLALSIQRDAEGAEPGRANVEDAKAEGHGAGVDQRTSEPPRKDGGPGHNPNAAAYNEVHVFRGGRW